MSNGYGGNPQFNMGYGQNYGNPGYSLTDGGRSGFGMGYGQNGNPGYNAPSAAPGAFNQAFGVLPAAVATPPAMGSSGANGGYAPAMATPAVTEAISDSHKGLPPEMGILSAALPSLSKHPGPTAAPVAAPPAPAFDQQYMDPLPPGYGRGFGRYRGGY